MEDINHFLSSDLLKDIMQELKKINLNNLLLRKYSYLDSLIYYDINHQPFSSSSFLLLRNALEPFNLFAIDIFCFCRQFKLSHSIACYTVELFDKFYTNLVSVAIKRHVIFSQAAVFDSSLTVDFGHKIYQLINSNCCFDYLFWMMFGQEINLKTRSLYVDNHARTITIVICIFIAAKLSSCHSELSMRQIKSFLYSSNVPFDYCNSRLLCLIEHNILNLLHFELNITPLNVYVETIMLIITRYMMHFNYITGEILDVMNQIATLLTQSYYFSRINLLFELFERENLQLFNIEQLDHVEHVENLGRDKLLIASGIVGAVCSMVEIDLTPETLLHFISSATGVDYQRINNCRIVFINYVLGNK